MVQLSISFLALAGVCIATPAAKELVCNRDNCLRNLVDARYSAKASAFCSTYTTATITAPTAIPTYLAGCAGSPSRVSSACACVVTATPTATACPLQFEGRVPKESDLTYFDNATSLFNPGYVKGPELWSQIIKFPGSPVVPSLFDVKANAKPLEVTISDKSIFAPNADYSQPGFRRAELLPASNSGLDNSTVGVKTLHFSLLRDTQRELNTSHEYQLVFLETNDFSTNQFALKYGTIFGREKETGPKDVLILQSNVRDPVDILKVQFKANTWHNFALTLDFVKNTIQVFYSENYAPLKAVTEVLPNDNSGQGQFHFGILKKPTGFPDGADITQVGYQPKNINEGVIFGGIFEEDSSKGCVSYL